MKAHEQHWEALIEDAKIANNMTDTQHSTKSNNSALALSIQHFNTLFKESPELAVATVLVNYFDTIDNCKNLSDFKKAQQFFNNALDFLHCEKLKAGISTRQKLAIFRGVTELHKEWCLFINENKEVVPHLKRSEFLSSINHLSRLNKGDLSLH